MSKSKKVKAKQRIGRAEKRKRAGVREQKVEVSDGVLVKAPSVRAPEPQVVPPPAFPEEPARAEPTDRGVSEADES